MPVHQVVVDVMLKPEILDPQGQAVANAVPTLGAAAPVAVRIGKHVELSLEAEDEQAALAAGAPPGGGAAQQPRDRGLPGTPGSGRVAPDDGDQAHAGPAP